MCLGCGYRLCGLPEPRCPECGRTFDPYDPETMKVPGYRGRGRPPATFGQHVIAAAVVGTILSACIPYVGSRVFAVLAAGVWAGIIYVWQRRNNDPGYLAHLPDGSNWRAQCRIFLVLSILSLARYHSCDHATGFYLGPLGISYSENGGPCRSSPHGRERLHRVAEHWYLTI